MPACAAESPHCGMRCCAMIAGTTTCGSRLPTCPRHIATTRGGPARRIAASCMLSVVRQGWARLRVRLSPLRKRDREVRRRGPAHVRAIHMRWTKNSGEGRAYHHGNLKEALVRAALELIAEKGPGGFTFAEAARWAGVSPAAPYRHYRDRDALLADVARRGFEAFADALTRAWDEGRPD